MNKCPFFRGIQFLAVMGGAVFGGGCLDSHHTAHAVPITETSVITQVVEPASAPAGAEPASPEAGSVESEHPPQISPAVVEIAKLAQSGMGEDVIMAYISNYPGPLNPTVDEILYLNDIGISERVLTEILKHKEAKPASQPQENSPVVKVDAPAAQNPTPTTASEMNASQSSTVSTTITAPAQQVTVDSFQQSLSPYGSWVQVENYGLCWQPTVVVLNPEWQPYCDRGRWIYSDCGWYWQSDYSWGWAPFHYGRWHRSSRYGWVWTPDSVWGPSWVSWRYSDSHCGWAPLPPTARYVSGYGFSYRDSRVGITFEFGLTPECYTFVPTRDFCDPHPYRHRLNHRNRTQIYNQTTVNNYYINNKNVVVNQGVAPEKISKASHKKIKKVAIAHVPSKSPATMRENFDKKSNTVFVRQLDPIVPKPTATPVPKGGGFSSDSAHTKIRGPLNSIPKKQPASTTSDSSDRPDRTGKPNLPSPSSITKKGDTKSNNSVNSNGHNPRSNVPRQTGQVSAPGLVKTDVNLHPNPKKTPIRSQQESTPEIKIKGAPRNPEFKDIHPVKAGSIRQNQEVPKQHLPTPSYTPANGNGFVVPRNNAVTMAEPPAKTGPKKSVGTFELPGHQPPVPHNQRLNNFTPQTRSFETSVGKQNPVFTQSETRVGRQQPFVISRHELDMPRSSGHATPQMQTQPRSTKSGAAHSPGQQRKSERKPRNKPE